MTSTLIKPVTPRSTGPLSPNKLTSTASRSAPHAAQSADKTLDRADAKLAPNPMTRLRRQMSPSDFNAAMFHFYRGEVQRSNAWRIRLDTTTNWAVITSGATLSFAFTSPQNPHFVIIINSLLVAFFLFMEARRYRYYEIWSSRVRILETGYLGGMLQPEHERDDSWADTLATDLQTPHFTISEWEAVGRRLRRNYLWIFILLAGSWNLKIYLHPTPVRDFDEFVARAAIGVIPGAFVFTVGVVFNAVLVIFAFATIRLRQATGEVLPQHDFNLESIRRAASWRREGKETRAMNRRAKRARARVRTTSNQTNTGEWRRQDLEAKVKQSEIPQEEILTR